MAKFLTTDIIRASAYITEHEGYVKRSENKNIICTADKVIDIVEGKLLNDNGLNDTKNRVIGWLDYINDANHQTGEYYENLRAEICKPMIDENRVGLIASSFASYDRYRSFKLSSDKDKESEFIGEEGDTVTFNIKEYRLVKSGTSKFNNSSSKWFLYKIKDDHQNIIIYFADHDCEFEFKHSDKAIATISKLNVYNEIKQTNVSKLKFL